MKRYYSHNGEKINYWRVFLGFCMLWLFLSVVCAIVYGLLNLLK